ncbi:uncharacterized protein LOC126847560 [Adelges cooleyi]|uniref:uncharacterized protein LOC126847560 n=1 Tax=Adelges cooleyi TaxID=133065 RepID=UPI00217FF883|nr:uncharacterized protein LOC126847560 [Adelges cooleyi]
MTGRFARFVAYTLSEKDIYTPQTACDGRSIAVRQPNMHVSAVITAAVALAQACMAITSAPPVSIAGVSIRMSLPDGPGLSGVCLFRDGKHVMFKSIASTRKHHDYGGDYLVAGDLDADRVYEGTFTRLLDGDQVARFGCKDGDRFEVATPFVVPEHDLDTMLAVKESMEQKLGAYKVNRVATEHVSVALRLPMNDRQDAAVTADVFQLYKKPGPHDSKMGYSAFPFARYVLRFPVDKLMLADLPPDQMIAVKLRTASVASNFTDKSLFLFTGGLYPRGAANLTRMLDTVAVVPAGIAQSKQSQLDASDILKNTVKCHADGMVYNGYPCRNSDVCIPLGWLCDNQKDCVEGEDEYNCFNGNTEENGNTNLYNNVDNWYYNRGTCRKYEFRCRSRRMSVCLPNSWLCDGRVDCDDGWDENEFNCGRTYNVLRPGIGGDISHREDILCKNRNSFKCWQGTGCVDLRSVCDGTKDCADGSDERVCDNWNSNCDQLTEFRCLNHYNTFSKRNCIPRQWVCDLQDDCPHGEDESVTSCLSMDHPTFNGLETDIVDF